MYTTHLHYKPVALYDFEQLLEIPEIVSSKLEGIVYNVSNQSDEAKRRAKEYREELRKQREKHKDWLGMIGDYIKGDR